MVDLPPQPFTTQSPLNTVVDFEDIQTGQGFVSFYPMTSNLAAGAEFILNDNIQYSGTIETNRVAGGTTTMTFDSSGFTIPRTVAGNNAYFSAGVGTANGATITVSAQLQKWDGSSATNISSEITTSGTAVAANEDAMLFLRLPLTETNVQEGEQLRIIVKLTNNVQDAAIGHDPKGRDGLKVKSASVSTVMQLDIPFKIE